MILKEAGLLPDQAAAPVMSALRRARMRHNWTLEQAIEQLDNREPEPTGITASMLSGWERGMSRSSPTPA